MSWQALCDEPLLRDLPFKVETNRWGKIEMSPATNRHGFFQILIAQWLLKLAPGGYPIAECIIQTTEGVKVADVAWASADFLRRHGVTNPYPEAPEIVVEILSPSNTLAEMEEKKELYFARGAREFWICEESGAMRFYSNHARLESSGLAAGFPARVELPFN
ncbi:MAG: Uma2 family endonuclease [Candidatus Competibacter denitrificans]